MNIYKNVMELLVEEEVTLQCRRLSSPAASLLSNTEVVAHALNQLPPLYATSTQGLDYQLQRGRVKYKPQIQQAVQRAIAAVQRTARSQHTPLQSTETRSVNGRLQFSQK